MIYGSVCSGIEAATMAWHPLGWKASFFSEIEKFPRQVLAHHYPDTPLHGDFTTIKKGDYEPIELLVGGTPCQSFSVAGLRAGLNDPRGNLMLEFGALAKRLQPKWLVWENVPGVLSSNGGKDLGSFLAMLGELGYGFSYRVLDAQYFGVPQRRRRVFVIGHLGSWQRAAAVLFERDSLQGNPAPGRETRQEVTGTLTRGFGDRGLDLDQIAGGAYKLESAGTITRRTGISRNNHEECVVVGALDTQCGFQNQSHQSINSGHIFPIGYREADLANFKQDEAAGTLKRSGGVLGGGSESIITCSYALAGNTIGRKPENGGNGIGWNEEASYTLTKTDQHAVAFNWQGSAQQGASVSEYVTPTLDKSKVHAVMQTMKVRRLTPKECERLQGFPDSFTDIPGASDSARYKALGNSMAVPVMNWIGKRIQMVEDLIA